NMKTDELSMINSRITAVCSKKKKLIRRYTRPVVEALKYIHENGFVHCDSKLPNILVFKNDNVKISDFDLVKETGVKER
ncbi:hypothetical protein RYX36_014612, partial [Vicia faba]